MPEDGDEDERFDLSEVMGESDSSTSFLDDVFVGDGQDAGEGDGLELDDSQAVEIRSIFLTSLPQYVLPVEQLVEQLLGAETPDAEVRKTLLTTLASIAEAAERLGIDDARDCLERMHVHVESFGEDPERLEDMKRVIADDLEALKQFGAEDADDADPLKPPPQTIVAAFQNVDDVDKSLLEQLTTAGLVTVDQLRQAAPEEIVAVTGLDAAVVTRLLNALGATASRGPSEGIASSRASMVDDSSAELPDEPLAEGLEGEMTRRLRARVEAEAKLEELRVGVYRLRARVERLRGELSRAEDRRASLGDELQRLDQRLGESMTARGQARERRDRYAGEREELTRTLERSRDRIPTLTQQRRHADAEQADLSASIAALSSKAQSLLRAARKAESDHAFRVHPARTGKRGA